jgi:hypothetical protein
MERITFADRDMAGSAVMEKDRDSVRITFNNSYSVKPYVVAVPNNDYAIFRVANISEEGFDILAKEKASADLEFTWHALAIFKGR